VICNPEPELTKFWSVKFSNHPDQANLVKFPGHIVLGLIVHNFTVPAKNSNPLPIITGHTPVTLSLFCSRLDLDHCSYIYLPSTERWSLVSQFPPSPHCLTNCQSIHAFLTQAAVAVTLNLLSPYSKISPSIAHTLNLLCTFTGSGQQSCLVTLCVPTINSHYHSQVNLVIGFHLVSMLSLAMIG